MSAPAIPGTITNASRKNGAVRDVRRMRGLERASELLGVLGGQAELAEALSIGTRLLRQKIAAERPVHDSDLRLAAGALSARAREADALAGRLEALIVDREEI